MGHQLGHRRGSARRWCFVPSPVSIADAKIKKIRRKGGAKEKCKEEKENGRKGEIERERKLFGKTQCGVGRRSLTLRLAALPARRLRSNQAPGHHPRHLFMPKYANDLNIFPFFVCVCVCL